MVPDLLELSLGECSAGAVFQKLAELFGGTFVVVESPRWRLGWQVQATLDSVEQMVMNCSIERLFECRDEVEVGVEIERARKEFGEFASNRWLWVET